MARNFTRELLKAHRPGVNRIVCSVPPYEGKAVSYEPRTQGDPNPWVLWAGASMYRMNGRECHVQTFRYAVVEDSDGRGFHVVDTTREGSVFGVAGSIAVDHRFSSRYAATDKAQRMETGS